MKPPPRAISKAKRPFPGRMNSSGEKRPLGQPIVAPLRAPPITSDWSLARDSTPDHATWVFERHGPGLGARYRKPISVRRTVMRAVTRGVWWLRGKPVQYTLNAKSP